MRRKHVWVVRRRRVFGIAEPTSISKPRRPVRQLLPACEGLGCPKGGDQSLARARDVRLWRNDILVNALASILDLPDSLARVVLIAYSPRPSPDLG